MLYSGSGFDSRTGSSAFLLLGIIDNDILDHFKRIAVTAALIYKFTTFLELFSDHL